MNKQTTIAIIAGTRPNFIKIAPIVSALRRVSRFRPVLVHTGQHYSPEMSRVFFNELGLPKPDINLEVGSGSQAEQTAKIMMAFDEVFDRIKPDLVLVVGDVNSTLACALVAKKRASRVAHVEAGLRSFDWSMPEEINRVLTDRISDYLFCTEPSGVENLRREGVASNTIFLVGNVMIDTLLIHKKRAEKSRILEHLHVKANNYAVCTLHRPSNVDSKEGLKKMLGILQKISKKMPVVFPIHPRTEKNLKRWKLSAAGLIITPPLGYLDFLKLMSHSRLVLTDSGGIQEETTVLGIPCVTLRENTERPITISQGTNHLAGTNPTKILALATQLMKQKKPKKRVPKFWDGKASERIVKILDKNLS